MLAFSGKAFLAFIFISAGTGAAQVRLSVSRERGF
jgi:hypothetical protein